MPLTHRQRCERCASCYVHAAPAPPAAVMSRGSARTTVGLFVVGRMAPPRHNAAKSARGRFATVHSRRSVTGSRRFRQSEVGQPQLSAGPNSLCAWPQPMGNSTRDSLSPARRQARNVSRKQVQPHVVVCLGRGRDPISAEFATSRAPCTAHRRRRARAARLQLSRPHPVLSAGEAEVTLTSLASRDRHPWLGAWGSSTGACWLWSLSNAIR